MSSPNHALRNTRERMPSSRLPGCPMSRDELASRVRIWLYRETGKQFALDERAIGRWERGAVSLPSAHYRAALRAVLQVGSDRELGFADSRGRNSAPSMKLENGQRPPSVEEIRTMAASMHIADRKTGGGRLYMEVVDYLQRDVARALFAPRSGAQVYAAAASLTEVAGWMAHDSGRDVDARTHFDGAYRLSLAAGSAALAANMCASMAHLATQLGQIDDAVRIADAGLDGAASVGGIGRIEARLYAMHATALACRGDRRGCWTSLGKSERALAGSNDHEHAAWAAYFDEGSLAAQSAHALHRLTDLRAAEGFARTVLDVRRGDRVRAHAFGQLSLARILLDANRHDEALDLGRRVATVIADLSSARVRSQLGALALVVREAPKTAAAEAFFSDVAALDQAHVAEAKYSWPL